jgi:hypothetical protein
MIGIFYLDYAEKFVSRNMRKMLIGYTKDDLLKKMEERGIQPDWYCWLSEARTAGFLIAGNASLVTSWIEARMPEKFGEPLRDGFKRS